jgi:gluconolactonase
VTPRSGPPCSTSRHHDGPPYRQEPDHDLTHPRWVRTATLDVYGPDRARVTEDAPLEVRRLDGRLDAVVPPHAALERIATGFEFTEGPVWTGGALLFSAPNTNTIYRWSPEGRVTVFRPESGYAGVDIGHHHQPGSNGLAVDPHGNLAICEHGNRRIIRVNPHGDITVLADAYDGQRLNSPNDLVFRSDGTLFFTDPPFGLPGQNADPKRELPFSGVFRARDGEVTLLTRRARRAQRHCLLARRAPPVRRRLGPRPQGRRPL